MNKLQKRVEALEGMFERTKPTGNPITALALTTLSREDLGLLRGFTLRQQGQPDTLASAEEAGAVERFFAAYRAAESGEVAAQ